MEEKKAFPVRTDDELKHIFREHNQVADHLANLVTEGHRKITIERVRNTEEWKAARGYWDGSLKNIAEADVESCSKPSTGRSG